MVNHRNKVKWEDPKTKDRVNLMHMKEGEYLVGFGGRLDSNSKEYNMHYFNQEECSSTKNLNQYAAKVSYN